MSFFRQSQIIGFSEVRRYTSPNRCLSHTMRALGREVVFRGSFQVLYHAL
jgi:hypothetical protein